MPLPMISAIPAQPTRGMSSSNSHRLYSAENTMPEYCRLATTRPAPWLYARVMHSCPSEAKIPTGSSHTACVQDQGETPANSMPKAPATMVPKAK